MRAGHNDSLRDQCREAPPARGIDCNRKAALVRRPDGYNESGAALVRRANTRRCR
ncbi:hypothetical protein LHK_00792 [Laribacter hongkongensis HLHK9]|uniref:Uncharacterized protein n=1 Tax=Laribacter hongkongensis (strain HLHK9) TaxID=557598 RepID=C1D4J0_LARHH|nr:hypothetical protein LHK_00792 [Laribacter hongkongensis HLHK9]